VKTRMRVVVRWDGWGEVARWNSGGLLGRRANCLWEGDVPPPIRPVIPIDRSFGVWLDVGV